MEASDFIDKYWSGSLPIDPDAIARRAGVVVVADSNIAPLSGMYERGDAGLPVLTKLLNLNSESDSGGISSLLDRPVVISRPTITYNPNEASVRQRFTIAHELGHHALGHSIRYRDPAANFSALIHDRDEVSANRFAAELLMPKDLLILKLREIENPTITWLAREFDVSEVAMKFRLKKLGMLNG